MAGPSTTVVAPAKLTLSLKVTGVRADGYHLIDAEMVSLDLHDRLTIHPAEHTSLAASGPYAAGVPLDDTNLVARALDLAGRPARVELVKQIPHGGGLGGGSSDAAAALRWAGWAPTPQALVLAATLGADVAYCLAGGRARVRGIGEIIDPLPPEPRTITLVIPPLRVSTPAVYAAWDHLGGPTASGPNDLEPAAVNLYPEMQHWCERIGEACGVRPRLAGSGATWFVLGEHEEALASISQRELGSEGADVIVARTI
ncbi:MAG TPA: 4-(cytidine 5'-diphospho)-2-C-methyl-D-erythritol kinase [Ilumatobacter sp.]|nr:4-(cytidine 5'-diphospho)-2-C-methyl-D-erythritol kinase [Ilumatobacter sp.]